MPLLIRSILILLLLAGVLAGAVWIYSASQAPVRRTDEPAAQNLSYTEAAPLRMLVVQEDPAEATKRLLICAPDACDTTSYPSRLSQDAVSDGEVWYDYVDTKEGNEEKRSLVQFNTATGEDRVLIEQTPLIFPRDLIISPDGQKVAYWLDNIEDEEKELTELWVYDNEAGGTRVVAENIVKPDVITRPRWNRSSSQLWFLADTAEEEEPDNIELLIAAIQPARLSVAFSRVDWATRETIARAGAMDVSLDGTSLAFVEQRPDGRAQLSMLKGEEPAKTTAIPAVIPYVQWLEDGRLLYAAQDDTGFSFWQVRDTVHSFVARREGQLVSALGDVRGEYIAFAVADNRTTHLYALQLAAGVVHDQGDIPVFGQATHLVHVDQTAQPLVAGITAELDDSELVAFVEQYRTDIVGPDTTPHRIIVTDQANTLFVDFRTQHEEQRIQLIVHDATHAEWSIVGRYRAVSGKWQKTEGGGLKDPTGLRIYEWEEEVDQWILKS